MTRRYVAFCADVELRLEQISEDVWFGYVIHAGLCDSYYARSEEAVKRSAIATVQNRFPHAAHAIPAIQWRDSSELGDEDWNRYLADCRRPHLP